MTYRKINSYRDALGYIYSFTDYEKKTSYIYSPERFQLSRVVNLLERLGNPHQQFKSIHIAGTKGKGSTAAITASILTAAGFRAGLYTSPHLHTFCERITVDGRMISRTEVMRLLDEIVPTVEAIPEITTFEIITALGFLYFARQGVDCAVIETGLGGRLDATNVISPDVTTITSISLDHVAILGDTIEAIAREKAGIIKPNTPMVSAPQMPEALSVIEAVCAEQNAPLTLVGRDWDWRLKSSSLDGQIFGVISDLPNASDICEQDYVLPLLGQHQLLNATVAIAVIHTLRERGVNIPAQDIAQGIEQVKWAARFELLDKDPPIIVDGAHNAKSAQKLRQTLHEYFPHRDITMIFGASSDKDIAGMLGVWLPMARRIVIMQSVHPRAAAVDDLLTRTNDFDGEVLVAKDAKSALDIALDASTSNDVICASGSLFVAADVRLAWLQRNEPENAPLTDYE